MSLTLPEPTEYEQDLSRRLQALVMQEIDRLDGFMSFDQYMHTALYTPGLGYYAAGAEKFGSGGDFVTAPELSPLFAKCLAQHCQQVLRHLSDGSILELGAGSGQMAAAMLAELQQLQQLPAQYLILEPSAELRYRQKSLLEQKIPEIMGRVVWLENLPDAFIGVVLANEVLDAMPVTSFEKREDALLERGVTYEDDLLLWAERSADARLAQAILDCEQRGWQLPYQSEINLGLQSWFTALESSLAAAEVLLIDYGYPRQEYYHPQRQTGTLICHYRHLATDDPFRWPGLQDISANVDFTAVAQAAVAAGFELAGFTTQAWFLLANGLEEYYQQAESKDDQERIELSRQIKLLTMPSEMGERFQVIGFTKGLELPFSTTGIRDLSHRL